MPSKRASKITIPTVPLSFRKDSKIQRGREIIPKMCKLVNNTYLLKFYL